MSLISSSLVDGVAILSFNNPPVNALSSQLRDDIYTALIPALSSAAVQAVVFIGGGRTWPVGADISEFGKKAITTPSPDTFIVSNKPIIAAIHGSAFGGGFEISLKMHYRIASSRASVGLPEVKLGLLPGGGGTQRLPRVVGTEQALKMMISGNPVKANKAHKLGLIDQLVQVPQSASYEEERAALLESAVSFARSVIGKPFSSVDARSVQPVSDSVWQAAAKQAAKTRRGEQAPLNIIECVKASFLPCAEGLQEERRWFLPLVTSSQSVAMRYQFFAEREVRKISGVDMRHKYPVRTVGVIGAGTMGGGIAMCLAQAGVRVTLLEVKQEAVDRGLKTIRANWMRAVKSGRMTEAAVDGLMARISPTLSYDDLRDVDMVIEAVFERMHIKKKIFSTLNRVCRADCVLATNTSYLDVDEIASATDRPHMVIGMHFFAPANIMKLVENVRGSHTSDKTISTVMGLSKKIQKVGVLVRNCWGFVGNRMFHPYTTEATFLVEDGASPYQVDRVMYDFGMAMGPMRVGDLSGLDIGWLTRQELGLTDPAKRDPAVRYSGTVPDALCELGRLGQKVHKGYYQYEGRKAVADPAVLRLIQDVRNRLGIYARDVTAQEIRERILFAMINEGFKVLEEGVADKPSDIDIVFTNGYGFPKHVGGPMHYCDVVGVDTVLRGVLKYGSLNADVPHWKPSALLVRLASTGCSLKEYWAGMRGKTPASKL